MDSIIKWRPPLHIFVSISVITLLAAALFDRQLVQCDFVSTNQNNNGGKLFYTHTGVIGLSDTSLDAFSLPRQYIYKSYEVLEAISNTITVHAKIAFVLEISAAYLVLLTVIGALSPSTFSARMLKIMGTLATASAITAAVFNSLLIGKANGVLPTDLPAFTEIYGITAINSCTMARAAIYAWVAAGLWLLIFLDGWRSMRK